MCIIIAKKRGFNLLPKDTLKDAFINNPDGAGYMFSINNKLIIKKGFMDFNSFYKNVMIDYKKYNLKEKNLIIHFRISTSHKINEEQCHPFILSDNDEELKSLYYKGDGIGLAHNGIIDNFSIYGDLNDTQYFIKYFLSKNIEKLDDLIDIKLYDIIKKNIGYSKLVLMNNKGTFLWVGDKTTDDNFKGYIFSNNTYKKRVYNYKVIFENDDILYNYNYYLKNKKGKDEND